MATVSWAAQVVNTRVSLDQVAAKYPQQQFKIGRCDLAACDGPWDGDDYGTAERFVRLWRGSVAEAERMEADLVRHARKKYAARCRIKPLEAAALSDAAEQVIFLAFWPKKS